MAPLVKSVQSSLLECDAADIEECWSEALRRAEEKVKDAKEILRKTSVKIEREERAKTISDLERILNGALRLRPLMNFDILIKVGIDVRYLPLVWEYGPCARIMDCFFRPMSAVTIDEHAVVTPSVDDSAPGNYSEDRDTSEGDDDSEAESDFWDDGGIDDTCSTLHPNVSDSDLLKEDYCGPSGTLRTVEIENNAESEAQMPVLDSPQTDDDIDRDPSASLLATVDGDDYQHVQTAYRIWSTFADLEREDFPDRSNVFKLVSSTNWRKPSRLPRPENVFGRFSEANSPIVIPQEYTPEHRWFVQNAWASSEGEPHEMFVVASPKPDKGCGALVHGEVVTILTALINRYKNGRPYLKRQKVMPIMLISIIGNLARIIQAHYDGENVVVRVSRPIDPEVVPERHGYELFARYLASEPVGDTTVFPSERGKKRTGGLAGIESSLESLVSGFK